MNRNLIINIIIIVLLMVNLIYSIFFLTPQISNIYSSLNKINNATKIENQLKNISQKLDDLSNTIELNRLEKNLNEKNTSQNLNKSGNNINSETKNNIESIVPQKALGTTKYTIITGTVLSNFRHGDLLFEDATTHKRYRLAKDASLEKDELPFHTNITAYITVLDDTPLEYDNIKYDAEGTLYYYEKK